MLYMDSQMENIRIDDLDISYRIDELFELEKENTLESENSLVNNKSPYSHKINSHGLSDLITDDERESNLC